MNDRSHVGGGGRGKGRQAGGRGRVLICSTVARVRVYS